MIIGITGTIGAGKGTIAKHFVEQLHFKHLSVRSFLEEILKEQDKELTRNNMVTLANHLRERYGPEYIALKLYEQAQLYPNSIIESIRTPGEVEALREKDDFLLLAVDADIEVRYERIKGRGDSTDKISFEEFKKEEERELTSKNPNKQNIGKCIEMADKVIYNNQDFEELFSELNNYLKTSPNTFPLS